MNDINRLFIKSKIQIEKILFLDGSLNDRKTKTRNKK